MLDRAFFIAVCIALCLNVQMKVGQAMESGIIEGFYGAPWTQEMRLDVIDFLSETGMAAYIYAPKDDPYHRELWRAPYPQEMREALRVLAERAEENDVRFIFAVSPGLSLHFTGEAGERDFADLMVKFRAMHDIGIRSFAVFFDDIDNREGSAQAIFLNRVARSIAEEHLSEAPLLTVPVEYFLEDMVEDGKKKMYTRDFSMTLDPSIDVCYTGIGVAKSPLSAATSEAAASLYDRQMTIWWNYPVNDYMEGKWALGAVEGISPDVTSSAKAIYFNPMPNWRLSRLALRTGADFARDPIHYDAAASMERALVAEYGTLAPAMRVVARHSQRLENHWAAIGDMDAPLLQAAVAVYWREVQAGKYPEESVRAIDGELREIRLAVRALQDECHGLDRERGEALSPQLDRLIALTDAAETILLYAQAAAEKNETTAHILYGKLVRQAMALKRSDARAPRISEDALEAFIDRAVIEYATMEE